MTSNRETTFYDLIVCRINIYEKRADFKYSSESTVIGQSLLSFF